MGDITLSYLLQLAWRRLWALILVAVLFAVGALAYCKFIAVPKYSAKSSIIVTNGRILLEDDKSEFVDDNVEGSVNGTDVSASLSLANTVVDIISSNDFYADVAESLNNDEKFRKYRSNGYKYNNLAGMVSVSRRASNTMAVDISVNSSNLGEAIDISVAVAEFAKEYIVKYIPQSKTEVLDRARTGGKTYPRTAFLTFASAVVGAVLAFLVVLLIDSLNQTIRGEDEFISKYDIPLLGSVPDFENVEIVGSYGTYKSKDGGAR